MAVIKCKMCGGDMEISADKTFGTCEFCGSVMTLPRVNDDQRAAAFNRGNQFRRMGEFDKALSVYERIVQEDDTDAEAHWCCALCRFGIEYVEDPTTLEYLPTCHRASFDSFLEDVDYLAAVEHSEGLTRRQYQKDAAKIAEVQRGILATSQNEEPFDVFICYKESDETGSRTVDSTLAQDIYYQLTEAGRRVFFARITLEDKAGTEYEPYIFAALNSAKVMIAVGTKPEYFGAVWVKNEWSRFLAMMKKDRSKLLLPCYRGMDPYDLPEALSVLQSYDMSKIGFIQDLIRGVNKVLDADKKPEPVKETVVVQQSAVSTTAGAQIKRGNMALEDHDWAKADEFFEEALNLDPECAEAYLGKMLTRDHCVSLRAWVAAEIERHAAAEEEKLEACPEDVEHIRKMVAQNAVDDYLEYTTIRTMYSFDRRYLSALPCRRNQKKQQLSTMDSDRLLTRAEKFAQGETKAQLANARAQIVKTLDRRIADAQVEDEASIARVKTEYAAFLEETDKKAAQLHEDAAAQKDEDYLRAVQMMKDAVDLRGFEKAKAALNARGGYKDSAALAEKCQKEIDRLYGEQRKIAARKTKTWKIIAAIVAASVVLCSIASVVVIEVIIPNNKYNAAVALMNDSKYIEAFAAFRAMNGYKDSAEQIEVCLTAIKDLDYEAAVALMNDGKYEEAIAAFKAMGGYKDSAEQIEVCQIAIKDLDYEAAVTLMDEGKIIDAYESLIALDGYKDSTEKANEIFKQYMKVAEVGDTVWFGAYEQDNNISNGKEDIEWLVLAKENNRILIISDKALDCRQYNNTSNTDVTWENCSLRKWMNGTFLNNAFSAEEQAQIENTNVSADKNPEYSTNPGNATKDKVFLLSITEVEKYFSSDNARQCKPTQFAVAHGGGVDSDNGNCMWWLRSPGHYSSVADVDYFGRVFYYGNSADNSHFCVRPALWINLE